MIGRIAFGGRMVPLNYSSDFLFVFFFIFSAESAIIRIAWVGMRGDSRDM
jgi:hypothetical protein